MPTLSQLGKQIEEVVAALNGISAQFALIGGLALASHKVVRTTQDVDLLADGGAADEIHGVLETLGYQCLHRSADAANYLRTNQRVDFLFARRPIARRLLAQAAERTTAFGVMRVVSTEGLIGLKLQGFVNNPHRTHDLEDIRALLRANRAEIDLSELREYFRLFDRESLLEELLNETA